MPTPIKSNSSATKRKDIQKPFSNRDIVNLKKQKTQETHPLEQAQVHQNYYDAAEVANVPLVSQKHALDILEGVYSGEINNSNDIQKYINNNQLMQEPIIEIPQNKPLVRFLVMPDSPQYYQGLISPDEIQKTYNQFHGIVD